MSGLRNELQQRLLYLLACVMLMASQNVLAWWLLARFDPDEVMGAKFWLTPMNAALGSSGLPYEWALALALYALVVAWGLALLSFRLARRARRGHWLAALSVVPGVQIVAILLNAILPPHVETDSTQVIEMRSAKRTVQGLIAGIAIIVLTVLVSAVTFGAYGWGLFVATPFLVGLTTGYLVNIDEDLGWHKTMGLVTIATGLGSLALVVFALEGIVCILLAAPLALPVALLGGEAGRSVAQVRLRHRNPLPTIALLPIIFMLEAAVPPAVTIQSTSAIDIDAPASEVWQALMSPEAITAPPGLPGMLGLAYPMSGKLDAPGMGSERIGTFSTGAAIERVTAWEPDELLAFEVVSQPPAMEEMSPYRRVHAPHLDGYFVTGETRFELAQRPGGGTRLRVSAEHVLRIDPAPYWEPIARLAIRDNVGRVLDDIKTKAERRSARRVAIASPRRLRAHEKSL